MLKPSYIVRKDIRPSDYFTTDSSCKEIITSSRHKFSGVGYRSLTKSIDLLTVTFYRINEYRILSLNYIPVKTTRIV